MDPGSIGQDRSEGEFRKYLLSEGVLTAAVLDECVEAQTVLAQHGIQKTFAEVLIDKGVLERKEVQRLKAKWKGGDEDFIPGYRVEQKLGDGAMGRVYRAIQLDSGRVVALKVLYPRFKNDSRYVQMFLRESKAAIALDHKNIVKGLDSGVARGEHYYYAMEYVEGGNLRDRYLKKMEAPQELDCLTILVQMGQALEFAGQHGILHRDIKPDNIIITTEGVIKLCDLGLAKPAGDTLGLTQTGIVVGTPYYISPEQGRAKKDIDFRSDMYSLGATLYHVATLRVPFDGEDALAVIERHCRAPLVPAHEVRPKVSVGLSYLLARMMEKEPGQRYATCAALIEDAQRVMQGKDPSPELFRKWSGKSSGDSRASTGGSLGSRRPSVERREKPAGRASAAADRRNSSSSLTEAVVPPSARGKGPSGSRKSRPHAAHSSGSLGVVWAGAAALLLVAGGIAFFVLRGGPDDPGTVELAAASSDVATQRPPAPEESLGPHESTQEPGRREEPGPPPEVAVDTPNPPEDVGGEILHPGPDRPLVHVEPPLTHPPPRTDLDRLDRLSPLFERMGFLFQTGPGGGRLLGSVAGGGDGRSLGVEIAIRGEARARVEIVTDPEAPNPDGVTITVLLPPHRVICKIAPDGDVLAEFKLWSDERGAYRPAMPGDTKPTAWRSGALVLEFLRVGEAELRIVRPGLTPGQSEEELAFWLLDQVFPDFARWPAEDHRPTASVEGPAGTRLERFEAAGEPLARWLDDFEESR